MSASRWYEIKAKQQRTDSQPSISEVLIYGDIGESWYGDSVSALDLVRELQALDTDELHVRINSYGGSVSDGLTIYNALRRWGAVTTYIDGVAVSIASLIAMAGTKVCIAENAMVMVHAPWTYASGNAASLRDTANLLDGYAKSMSSSYARKTGMAADEVYKTWLEDGEDHWFSASEALAAGLVDEVIEGGEAAAKGFSASKFNPSGRPSGQRKEAPPMQVTIPAADPAASPAGTTQAAVQAAAAATPAMQPDDATRLLAVAARYVDRPAVAQALHSALTQGLSFDAGNALILSAMAQGVTPANPTPAASGAGDFRTLQDERDKRIEAMSAVIISSGGRRADASLQGNPYIRSRMYDLAEECARRAGVDVRSMGRSEVVQAAMTQSTSDFPLLLENTMNKTLQAAYAVAPHVWREFCRVGSLSDFRPHNRYFMGSFGVLDPLLENGEYTQAAIPDGEKASITGTTRGKLVSVTRQMIINDDMDAFSRIPEDLGRAAARTLELAFIGLLKQNGGLGPVMGDGYTLFHANHSNIGTAPAAPSTASFDDVRVLLSMQKDPSGNDVLDLIPARWLGPAALRGAADVANRSEYDTNATGGSKNQNTPNSVQNMFERVVSTGRLNGTRWYAFADPKQATVIEMAFLDGVEQPFLDLQPVWNTDGLEFKARQDFAIGAISYRGAVTNAGV